MSVEMVGAVLGLADDAVRFGAAILLGFVLMEIGLRTGRAQAAKRGERT